MEERIEWREEWSGGKNGVEARIERKEKLSGVKNGVEGRIEGRGEWSGGKNGVKGIMEWRAELSKGRMEDSLEEWRDNSRREGKDAFEIIFCNSSERESMP